jgi:hypothetical protein
MTIEPVLIDLGAGFIASDAVRSGERRAILKIARSQPLSK